MRHLLPVLISTAACGGAPFVLLDAPAVDASPDIASPADDGGWPLRPEAEAEAGRDALGMPPHRDAGPDVDGKEVSLPEASPPDVEIHREAASPEASPAEAAAPEASLEASTPDVTSACPSPYDWSCGTNGALVTSPSQYCVYFNRTGYVFPVSACPYNCAAVLAAVGGESICGQVGGGYVACEEPGSLNSPGVTVVCR